MILNVNSSNKTPVKTHPNIYVLKASRGYRNIKSVAISTKNQFSVVKISLPSYFYRISTKNQSKSFRIKIVNHGYSRFCSVTVHNFTAKIKLK